MKTYTFSTQKIWQDLVYGNCEIFQNQVEKEKTKKGKKEGSSKLVLYEDNSVHHYYNNRSESELCKFYVNVKNFRLNTKFNDGGHYANS